MTIRYQTRRRNLHLPCTLCTVALSTAMLLATPGAFAQKWRLPDSPTGRALTSLLEALDDGGDEKIGHFVDEMLDEGFHRSFSRGELIGVLSEVHETMHPFELEAVEKKGDWSAECVLGALENEGRIQVTFELSPRAPHRFAGLDFQPYAEREMRFSSLEELDSHLSSRAENGDFSGVVLVAREGEVMFHEAYGLANRRYAVNNRPDTKLNIGSINKMFTSVAILQLAESKRLELDDPVGKYLSGLAADVGSDVTIRYLLQHRSGWGDYFDNEHYLNTWPRLRTVDDYMAFIRDIPLNFEPGSSRAYSNAGYVVLGAVIEAITGQDYYDYVREHIFEPAGMADTDSYEVDATVPNLATGYVQDARGEYMRENTFLHSARGTPAGGGYSTAEDLLRFDTALGDGRLLSPPFVNLLWDRFQEGGSDEAPGGEVGYAGGGPGINAVVEKSFDSGLLVIVLANLDPPVAEELGQPIMRIAGEAK